MVVLNRKMEAIAKLIDEKLDAFKNSLVESLTNQIEVFTDEQKREIEGFVDNKKAFFSSQVTEYAASVKVIQQHVKELKEENNNLKKVVNDLHTEVEDLQQYIRRQNVRIFGVKVHDNETSEQVEQFVKDMISDGEIDIPLESLDGAHRIGKKKTGENGVTQPIIVRFTSFRARKIFYRGRKTIKQKKSITRVLSGWT